jgi:hypothetical protein
MSEHLDTHVPCLLIHLSQQTATQYGLVDASNAHQGCSPWPPPPQPKHDLH